LANDYSEFGETDLARQSAQRAYDLWDRCTEPERLLIEARYYELATGELERVAAAYKQFAQTYPREIIAVTNLAATYWVPWANMTSAWLQASVRRNSRQ
jgi:hypothetical protein